jgi:hypothetical protein
VALSFAGWDLLQAVGHLQTVGYGRRYHCRYTSERKEKKRHILVRQKPQKNFRGERNFRAAENPTNFQTESLFVLEENPKEQTAKERAERRESREKKREKKFQKK